MGLEGYAIYFMLLEVLREENDFKYPQSDLDLLADDFGTSEPKVNAVVMNYGLFEVDDGQRFFSSNLIRYLEPYFNMKEQRRLAGKKSGEARRLRALKQNNNERPFNNSSTEDERRMNENEQRKGKESKVKKSKKGFTPPTLNEVKEYFRDNGYSEKAAEKAYHYYNDADWHDSKGNKVKSWKQKMRGVWFSDENKDTTSKRQQPKPELYR